MCIDVERAQRDRQLRPTFDFMFLGRKSARFSEPPCERLERGWDYNEDDAQQLH
jgi:hypothetical protein